MKSRYLILLVAVIIFAVLIVSTNLASCAPVGIGSAENNNILLKNVPTKTSPDGITKGCVSKWTCQGAM